MFRSVRIKNIWLTVFSLIGVLFFVAVCLTALRAGSPDTVAMGEERVSLIAEDDEDLMAFLAACGCQDPALLYEHEITVPKHWNATYTAYNVLQREQGFDLVPYKGKAATELAYADGDRCITLLVCEQKIIAAHCCDPDGSDLRVLIEE